MEQCEDLSILIGDIYDAAIDRSLWVSVLAKCTQFTVGSAAALFSKDAARKSGNAVYDYGIDPHFRRLYFDKVASFDPLTVGHYFAKIGEPMSVADIMPYNEFIETRAYLEWGRPQGIVDTLNVALDKTATSAAFFAIFRHERQGRVDDEARRRMRLIAPHVRRSVLIGNVIDLKAAEAGMFSDTLDSVRDGILFVDDHGKIVYANAPGHALLAQGSLLRADGQKIAFADPEAERALYDVFRAAGKGDTAVGTKGIAVTLNEAHDGERYVAHVLPLTSGARLRAGATYAAVAALFVHKATLNVPSPPEILARTYKLTPTELRVLLAIVQVGGVPETAVALGIAETTVKTHLRRLFDKTSSTRQADLVKLVAAFSGPFDRQ
jgi:DNA-binding CsgD family transcriptional regulator/PAS domain-containing protein